MQGNDKAISSLIRSMKRTLKDKHGINVPHSALRASYLLALGENPHAFAGREQATESKLDVSVPAAAVQDTTQWRVLYLAEDDIGCLERLALDPEGFVLLPEDFVFGNAKLERQFAELPRISKYEMPDYLVNAAKFYASYGLEVSDTYEYWSKDLGDDSGDRCKLVVSMSDTEWDKLLKQAVAMNPIFVADVAEWVGLHYQRMFSNESEHKQLEWVRRYLDSLEEAEALREANVEDDVESAKVDVKFEWVLEDGSRGGIEAYVELDTGLVVFQDAISDDVQHPNVRKWIRVPHKGDTLETMLAGETHTAYYERNFAGGGVFKVWREAVTQIAAEHELPVFRR